MVGALPSEGPPALNGECFHGREGAEAGRAFNELCVEGSPTGPWGPHKGAGSSLGLLGTDWRGPHGHRGMKEAVAGGHGDSRVCPVQATGCGGWVVSRCDGVCAHATCPACWGGSSQPQSWVKVHMMLRNQQAFPTPSHPLAHTVHTPGNTVYW